MFRHKDQKTERQKDKKTKRQKDKKTMTNKRVQYCDVRAVWHSCDVSFYWLNLMQTKCYVACNETYNTKLF